MPATLLNFTILLRSVSGEHASKELSADGSRRPAAIPAMRVEDPGHERVERVAVSISEDQCADAH